MRVLVIPKQIFLEELKNNNGLKQDVFDLIALRMHHLIAEIKFLHVANLHQKICKTLLNLALQYGLHHPLGIEIYLKISQHDLADLLSTSRQTINKEIKNLVGLNIIEWQYENIVIKDLQYLKYKVNDI